MRRIGKELDVFMNKNRQKVVKYNGIICFYVYRKANCTLKIIALLLFYTLILIR